MQQWMLDAASRGRVCLGKSRGGSAEKSMLLNLSERWVYRMQETLEQLAEKQGPYVEVLAWVSQREELREAVERCQEEEEAQARIDGGYRARHRRKPPRCEPELPPALQRKTENQQ